MKARFLDLTKGPNRLTILALAIVLLSIPSAHAALTAESASLWMETAKITPEDAAEPGVLGRSHWGVTFGSAVAVDQDTLVVGTQWDRRGDAASDPGEEGFDWVYVFQRTANGSWQQTAKIIPDDEQAFDTFGYSVAVDEEAGLIAVGNPKLETIYLFEAIGDGSWDQVASFNRPHNLCAEKGWCFFGFNVDVSGDRVISSGVTEVFVFDRVEGTWTETASLPGSTYVALAGDTLVASGDGGTYSWSTFVVWEHGTGGWTEAATFEPPEDDPQAVGGEVDLTTDGQTLIMGLPVDRRVYGVNPEGAVKGVGSMKIFERIDGAWAEVAEHFNPDPGPEEVFGTDVAISGDVAVVGARGDVHNGGLNVGAAYVYEKVEGVWMLASKLRNHDAGPGVGIDFGGGDWFGASVDVSGSTVVVGAPLDDNRRDGSQPPLDDFGDLPPCLHRELVWGCDEGENAGAVYVFEPVAGSSTVPSAP